MRILPTGARLAIAMNARGGHLAAIRNKAAGGLLMLLCLAASGCLTMHRDVDCLGSECLGGTPHVEVLRGISGYWPGAERFQQQLAARGIGSTVSYCELYPRVAERLIQKHRQDPCSPIVVVGYSLGANHALRLSRRLQEEGIAVDALVLLETTYEDTVPSNVQCCFNAYKPRFLDEIPFMRGIPLQADSPYTQVTNYDLRAHDDGRYRGENHLTLCADEDVQCLLADVVAGSFAFAPPTAGHDEMLHPADWAPPAPAEGALEAVGPPW